MSFFSGILDSLRKSQELQAALQAAPQADTGAAAPVKPSPQSSSSAGWLAPLINSVTPFIRNTVEPAISSLRDNAKDWDWKSSEWTDPAQYAAYMAATGNPYAQSYTSDGIKSYSHSAVPYGTRTLFNQQATDPITGTEGKRYAFGGMTDSTPQFNNPFGPQPQQMQPPSGGGYNQQNSNVFGGFAPQPTQFQNPFGPQQPPNGQRMYSPGPTQPQSVSVGGSPQQSGLPSLLSSNTQNQYPNGYTPIGPKQQNFISG